MPVRGTLSVTVMTQLRNFGYIHRRPGVRDQGFLDAIIDVTESGERALSKWDGLHGQS